MAGQLRLWPWVAAATFFVLGTALRSWASKKQLVFFSRAWILWLLACVLGAAFSSQALQGLPMNSSAWLAKWRSGHWQLGLWTLSSAPALIALCLDLRSEGRDFEGTKAAAALGFAFGPALAGAFPLQQLAGLAWPLAVLTAALRISGKQPRNSIRPLWVMGSLNLLAFAHGLFFLPWWAGSLGLAALLSFGLNPGAWREGLAALILGALGIFLKARAAWDDPWRGPLAISVLIYAGWSIISFLPGKRRAETP